MRMLESDCQHTYTPDPGKDLDDVGCGVCGAKMDVKRDCFGPRSAAAQFGGAGSPYDSFRCPNYAEAWHRQAVGLRYEARQTNSAWLTERLRREADEVIASQRETKA